MSRAELETQILVNREDYDAGFFLFYTTERSSWDKMLRRVGEENLISYKTTKAKRTGQPTSWEARLPIAYLSRSWGISTKRQVERAREMALEAQRPPEPRAQFGGASPA